VDYDLTAATLKMFGVLGLILGLLIGAVWLLRRFMSRTGGPLALAGGELAVLAQYPLGPKKVLALVRVADEVLLLGVTEANINLLSRIEDEAFLARLKRSNPSRPGDFRGLLKRLTGRSGQESGT